MQERAEREPAPSAPEVAPAERATAEPASAPANPMLGLQQRAGNAAVLASLGIQPKLQVGAVDDPAEREADRVAAVVVRQLESGPDDAAADEAASEVGRRPGALARSIRRRAKPDLSGEPGHGLDGGDAAPEVAGRIEQSRGGGKPMDAATRGRMESAFGADMSSVRIHTGGEADSLSRDLNAKAFTTGSDVYFAGGEYDPGSKSGQTVLAHELAHTVQQGGGAKRLPSIRWAGPKT